MVKHRVPEKIQIQFRIGMSLLAEIDYAVTTSTHNSRNTWLVAAIRSLSDHQWIPVPHPVIPSYLLRNKTVAVIRMEDWLLQELDYHCQKQGVDRTLVILDAVTSYLAKQHGGKQKGRQ